MKTLLIVLLLASTSCFAQLGNLEGRSFQNAQQVKFLENEIQVEPLILVTNTERITAPDFIGDMFNEIVSKRNELFHFRVYSHYSNKDIPLLLSQKAEKSMFTGRGQVHSGNYIAACVEEKLQRKLQPYFPQSVVSAYRINRNSENTLSAIATEFNAHFVVSPALLRLDTVNYNQAQVKLQLEMYDARTDTLLFVKLLETRAENLSAALSQVVEEASAFIFKELILDKSFRPVLRLAANRRKALQQMYKPEKLDWAVQQIKADTVLQYIDTKQVLFDSSGSKCMILGMSPNRDDLENGLSSYQQKRFSQLGVSVEEDPEAHRFEGFLVLGAQHEKEWLFTPLARKTIYTSNPAEAMAVLELSPAVYGFFADSSTSLNADFWNSGEFERIDTANVPPHFLYANHKKIPMSNAPGKFRVLPYIGLTKLVQEHLRERHKRETKRWNAQTFTSRLVPMLEEYEDAHDDFLDDIDTDLENAIFFNDFKRERLLVAVKIENKEDREYRRFFYWNANEKDTLYVWKRFDEVKATNSKYTERAALNNKIGEYAPWNPGDPINDETFWQEHVLAKNETGFKFLELVVAGYEVE